MDGWPGVPVASGPGHRPSPTSAGPVHVDLSGEGDRVRPPAAGAHEHQHDPALDAAGRLGVGGRAGSGVD